MPIWLYIIVFSDDRYFIIEESLSSSAPKSLIWFYLFCYSSLKIWLAFYICYLYYSFCLLCLSISVLAASSLEQSCSSKSSNFSLSTANLASSRFRASDNLCLSPDIFDNSAIISSPFAFSRSSLSAWYYLILFCLKISKFAEAAWACWVRWLFVASSSWFSLWAF